MSELPVRRLFWIYLTLVNGREIRVDYEKQEHWNEALIALGASRGWCELSVPGLLRKVRCEHVVSMEWGIQT